MVRILRLMLIIGSSLLIIWAIGCTSPKEQGELSNHLNSPSHSATSTEVYGGTLIPSRTATITGRVELVEPTVLNSPDPTNTLFTPPTVIPTWTVVPTLSPEQALATILELYEDNGGCELPCWWGVVPGVTTWEEVHSRFSPLGKIYGPIGNTSGVLRYEFEFVVPEYIDPWGYATPGIWIRDGVVLGIATNSGTFRNDFATSLAGWLGELGSPGEIWLDLIPISQIAPHYHMDLYYPEIGILVHMSGNARVVNNWMTICPQYFMQGQLFPPPILLWNPEEETQYQSLRYDLFRSLITLNTDRFSELETLIPKFNTEDFFQTYLDPNATRCFDIDVTELLP